MKTLGQATVIAAALAASVTPGTSMPGGRPKQSTRRRTSADDVVDVKDHPMIGVTCKSHNGTGYLGTVVSACATHGVSYLTLEMESGLRMTFEERSVKPV